MLPITFHPTGYDPALSPLENGRAFAIQAGVPDATIRSAWASDATTFGDCHQIIYLATPEEARKLIAVGESKADSSVSAPQLAAMTLLANQLLNLDEVLNK